MVAARRVYRKASALPETHNDIGVHTRTYGAVLNDDGDTEHFISWRVRGWRLRSGDLLTARHGPKGVAAIYEGVDCGSAQRCSHKERKSAGPKWSEKEPTHSRLASCNSCLCHTFILKTKIGYWKRIQAYPHHWARPGHALWL